MTSLLTSQISRCDPKERGPGIEIDNYVVYGACALNRPRKFCVFRFLPARGKKDQAVSQPRP